MNLKQIWKPVLAIALAAAVLFGLSAALQSTAARRELDDEAIVMSYMLENGGDFTEEPYSGEDPAIQRVFRGNNGYILEVAVDGYAAPMTLWVAVKDDGYVTGLTVRDMDETYGLGREAMFDVDFLLQFLRNTGDSAVGENVDAMTGATVTSRAVTKAVNAAVAFVTGADVSSGATEWGG